MAEATHECRLCGYGLRVVNTFVYDPNQRTRIPVVRCPYCRADVNPANVVSLRRGLDLFSDDDDDDEESYDDTD